MSKIFASIKILTLCFAFLLAAVLISISYNHTVFGYTLLRGDWSYYADPMGESMVVYENTSDTTGVLNAILNAMNTWDNAGARFKFTYGGIDTKPVPNYDNVNQIRWDQRDGDYFLAQATMWFSSNKLIEADVVFNDRYTWATGSYIPSGSYDVESVALHELGHVLGLDHYYAPAIMQGTIGSGVKRRALTTDDINGILAIYGPASGTTTPDTIPPTVSITEPLSNSTVLGIITIRAAASDNIGVSRVEFYKDNILLGSDTLAPYETTWDTRTESNGLHTLKARAYDAANNTSENSIGVTVNNPSDTVAPTVTILSPANGSTLPNKGTVKISVSASDNANSIAQITISIDGGLRKICSYVYVCEYNWSMRKIPAGNHIIGATAADTAYPANTGTTSITVIK